MASRAGRMHDAHLSMRSAMLVWILASIVGWGIVIGVLLPLFGWFV